VQRFVARTCSVKRDFAEQRTSADAAQMKKRILKLFSIKEHSIIFAAPKSSFRIITPEINRDKLGSQPIRFRETFEPIKFKKWLKKSPAL
jgi:hypothetical protein